MQRLGARSWQPVSMCVQLQLASLTPHLASLKLPYFAALIQPSATRHNPSLQPGIDCTAAPDVHWNKCPRLAAACHPGFQCHPGR